MKKQIFSQTDETKEITFPVTVEEFTAYQKADVGRELTDREKELIRLSVEILNESYERGKIGERLPFPESEEAARQILSDFGKDYYWESIAIRRYLYSMMFWTQTAYGQGQKAAQA